MCGIIAIADHPNAAQLVRLGLHNLQHRGEEAVGIASALNSNIYMLKKRGWVGDVITDDDCKSLLGSHSIGHVRYSTEGGPMGTNTQPLFAKLNIGPVAIAHNGHIANNNELRSSLENDGAIFQTSSDTEVILHLVSRSKEQTIFHRLQSALKQLSGSYSLVLLHNSNILIARDPNGIRPMVYGELGGSSIIASESCAIEVLGGTIIGDIPPGTISNIKDFVPRESTTPKICIFEYVYFARPDSVIESIPIYRSRTNLGVRLAIECPVDGDIVVPVPDSGIEAAIGYSKESGIPFEKGIIRAHYAGRTFIQPGQILRNRKIRMKLNPVSSIIRGKKVIIVDDSIVRGNTSKRIVSMLREAGALEVHMCISSPPIISPCYYGIDTPSTEELIASQMSVEEIKNHIGCNSLQYISQKGMCEAIGLKEHCDACFTKNYPI